MKILPALFIAAICLITRLPAQNDMRQQAEKLQKDGNYKEALTVYKKLLTSDQATASDLTNGIDCLRKLQSYEETDALLESAIEKHPTNRKILATAATQYMQLPHHGEIIAGQFKRNHRQGGGEFVQTAERDRIRAIQLCLEALKHFPADMDQSTKQEMANVYQVLSSNIASGRLHTGAWRLQKLSDLTELPDYEKTNRWNRYGSGGRDPQGAPVTADGSPLYYSIPDSWENAKNDGERWRFCQAQRAKLTPSLSDHIDEQWADFLHNQFGITTMRNFSWFGSLDMDQQKGILQLHTLTDDETLAKLATGVKRFKLAEGQNFIQIYHSLSTKRESSADRLIQIYLDRRQHEKSAALLEKTIEQFPKSHSLKNRQKLLAQITGNWGRFEPNNKSFPAGTEASVDYVFRNAKSVTLVAREVDMTALVNDLWKYLEGNPLKLDWQTVRWNSLGNDLVNGKRKKYLGEEVGRRTHELKPRDHHWDTRATLSVPVKKSGAYLISAELENGVTTHTVVWLDASVIVKKDVNGGELYYVADAITGKAIAGATVEFFGYRQEYRKENNRFRKYDFHTKRAVKTTGDDGTVLIKNGELPNNYQWMVRAKTERGSALLGFTHIGSSVNEESGISQTKSFGITDRPVYQPDQEVFGKFWIRHARYDLKDVSTFAGQKFTITINDAAGNAVLKEHPVTADAYGGVEYTYKLPEDAKLGAYAVQLRQGNNWRGNHSFRVEEYKKPEYEVSVHAPKEPVMLGEKFEATIKANYYHGAPVTEAKVKIKVMRTRHNDRWFPIGRWDWLYGGGYGWLDIERPWYPGWKRWGCLCPSPWWWNRGGEQPEIVLEQELKIGPDGTVKVEIDTALAKAVHSDTNHSYEVTAEVVDASRRTIVGKGSIIAARRAYQVSVWLDRGYAHVGDAINATVAANTADGKHVETKGKAILYCISTDKDGKVIETEVKNWEIDTANERNGSIKFQAGAAGQYRLSAQMTDSKGREIEGAILFTVRGDAAADGTFQYSDLELIADKRTYEKGSTVKLLINTKRPNSTVLLSLRNGMEHRFVHIKGQSAEIEIPVEQKDMPNFFIEAATVSNAEVHTAVREIIVPPEKRILNVEVLPSADRFKPRGEGKVKVRITDQQGEPVKGSLALTIYDKSLEYISGGSNVTEIKAHFWKWRRNFRGGYGHSTNHYEGNVLKEKTEGMQTLGAFGHSLADSGGAGGLREGMSVRSRQMSKKAGRAMPAPMALAEAEVGKDEVADGEAPGADDAPAVMVRKDFADLVKWIGTVETNDDGVAEVPVTFPDNLTTWKIKTWAMAHGTRVGEGSAEVITSKDLIIRLQAPRFFIEKDEVVLSAVVHNYLKTEQDAKISLELEGGTLKTDSEITQQRTIKAGGETRIEWLAKVSGEGTAIVRMKVITADDSDAMEMTYPVYVHGILKQEAWSKVVEPGKDNTVINFKVPAERRPDQTRLEIRYSPTIAGSIVDAIPYLVEYPYGCTEQTLNRFVPTVIAQKLIKEMGIDLEGVRNKRANLNPQEIGDDKERMAQWQRWQRNPVFNENEVNKMTRAGIKRLAEMQLTDGGWGWFSGWGERSYPHTTAIVVHGLLIAKAHGVAVDEGMLDEGVTWLKNYEVRETEKIRMWEKRKKNTKRTASAMDAFVRLVLAEAESPNKEMLGYLFRDKNELSVYAKSLTGMALHLAGDTENRDAVIRNIEQFLVYDDENQSAYLKLGNNGYWWYWYGSEMEAHAWYLKLLAATNPKSKQARGLVKYLINNRKHATYWNSTRDTAYCIEAIADYMRASGENNPDAEVTVSVDGKEIKTVKISKDNLFSYDNKVVIAGDALGTGDHKIEIVRKGKGALYTNAYLTVFTKEDFIKKAGLEVKVDRAYYKLERIDATESTAGTKGQVVDHKVEKYKRIPMEPGDMVTSGDLIEVELHIHSKNDYEYLMFSDWKPAGLEAVKIQSGYTGNSLGAYMEMRNERTAFFVRRLPRGEHSFSYRLRAEIPGSFSALPTIAEAMYAPELKANSDEMKVKVKDK
ncbi:alpha-2-macroglobulin [Oceaniferula spumae]|uniref:Alpha-2-macroglobulin n=1 Tax=Oceaniferula spumae TaxID=2979115 RepID=A0AAT9FLQ9_9BACT